MQQKLFQLFINYHKFYRKQYPLPAVSRLASRGEQWLHVCNIYTDRSQERSICIYIYIENHHSAKEKRKGNGGSSNRNLRGRNKPGKEKPSGLCKFCGTEHPYNRAKCPASGKTCHKCGKQGHFAVKCHVKR